VQLDLSYGLNNAFLVVSKRPAGTTHQKISNPGDGGW
jgi:hypothetical protein